MVRTMKTPTSFHVTNEIISLFERVLLLLLFLLPLLLLLVGQNTIAAIESARQIETVVLESLSEQQLVDCDTKQYHGCNGGL